MRKQHRIVTRIGRIEKQLRHRDEVKVVIVYTETSLPTDGTVIHLTWGDDDGLNSARGNQNGEHQHS